jgi:hypothetical protein
VPSQKFGHEFSIRADAQVTHRTQTFHWLWCLSKTVSSYFDIKQKLDKTQKKGDLHFFVTCTVQRKHEVFTNKFSSEFFSSNSISLRANNFSWPANVFISKVPSGYKSN